MNFSFAMLKASMLAMIALAIAPYLASADVSSPQNADQVVSALVSRMAPIAGYTAHFRVDVALHSFPYLSTTLEGKAQYQRPSKYTVTFDSVPGNSNAFQKVTGDIGDPAGWSKKYDVTVDRSAATAPAGHTVLRLTQKVHGQIDHALAYIDEQTDTITRMEWYYYSGGHITVDQTFAPQSGVLMVDHQTTDIDMPGYKATLNAVFDRYDVQVGMTATATP